MADYIAKSADTLFAKVEFNTVPEGNRAVFYARNAETAPLLRDKLEAAGQIIQSQSQIGKRPVFVTRGPLAEKELLKTVAPDGGMSRQFNKRSFRQYAWQIRSGLGILGQSLVLYSSISSGKFNPQIAKFAGSNLIANLIVMFYGSAKSADANRLTKSKTDLNLQLASYVDAEELPTSESKRSHRYEEFKPATIGSRLDSILRGNSSNISIGLRYFGAWNLFSRGIKTDGFFKLAREHPTEALKNITQPANGGFAAKTNRIEKSKFWTGAAILTGKTLSVNADTPDPYSNTKPGFFGKLREKVFFNLGGFIEMGSYARIAFENFKGLQDETGRPNYFRATGFSMFTLGYLIRSFAKSGVREMDFKELYSHTVDSLAKIPADKRQEALTRAATQITNDFSDKNLRYVDVYDTLRERLFTYHNIGIGSDIAAASAEPSALATTVPDVTVSQQITPALSKVVPVTNDASSPITESTLAQKRAPQRHTIRPGHPAIPHERQQVAGALAESIQARNEAASLEALQPQLG